MAAGVVDGTVSYNQWKRKNKNKAKNLRGKARIARGANVISLLFRAARRHHRFAGRETTDCKNCDFLIWFLSPS